MSIFNRKSSKLTPDDEKIIQFIIDFLDNKLELDTKGKAEILDLEEWNSIVFYSLNHIEFNHKLQTSFSYQFDFDTNNNTLILHNFHRISIFKKMGYGTFVLRKLTEVFRQVCRIKQISKLVIIFEIWGIEDPSSESVRKLLQKEGYTKIEEQDPEQWMIQYEIK